MHKHLIPLVSVLATTSELKKTSRPLQERWEKDSLDYTFDQLYCRAHTQTTLL